MKLNERYLDLIKKTLTFHLWEEIGIPLETHEHDRKFYTNFLLSALSKLLRRAGFKIVQTIQHSHEDKTQGKIWPQQAHSMIGLPRMDNIQACVEEILREKIPGDLIETGAWKGGAAIFMRAILAVHDDHDRRVYVADSFAGLPPPDSTRYPQDRGDIHHTFKNLAISQEEVEGNFKKYNLLDDQVVFLKGWFKDTLPTAPIKQLAVLRLDGDMYQSTMEALTHLYPKLSTGGFCIIDDYALKGCRQAVDDYRSAHAITTPLEKIDWSGVCWRK